MTIRSKFLTSVTVLASLAATSLMAQTSESLVKTHPSQGDVTVVEGAQSQLITGDEGVYVRLDTSGLNAGNVYTYWMVVFNDPSQCEAELCSGKDALMRTEIVQADAGYIGGTIVGEDGTLSMSAYQSVGQLTKNFFGRGIQSTQDLEVHIILQDHGPVIEGRDLEMLSTYRGGCSDESLPPPFPDTAKSQGNAGPNQCRMVQFTIFPPNA